MNSVKVKKTISLNGIDCVKGKLVLVWGDCRDEEFHKYGIESHDKTQFAKPIIISETEPVEPGDAIAHHEYGIGKVISRKALGDFWICQFDSREETETVIGIFKIIAFPENFSPEELKTIRLCPPRKEFGEDALIECVEVEFSDRASESISHDNINFAYFVKLNKDNHINIIMAEWETDLCFYSNGAYIPRHQIERCERCGQLAFQHSDIKLRCPENSWEEVASSFGIWAWGKEIPSEISKLKEFFMRFAHEVASHKYNHPIKK